MNKLNKIMKNAGIKEAVTEVDDIYNEMLKTARPKSHAVEFIPESLGVRNLATFFAESSSREEMLKAVNTAWDAAEAVVAGKEQAVIGSGVTNKNITFTSRDFSNLTLTVVKGMLKFVSSWQESTEEMEIRIYDDALDMNHVQRKEQKREAGVMSKEQEELRRLLKKYP